MIGILLSENIYIEIKIVGVVSFVVTVRGVGGSLFIDFLVFNVGVFTSRRCLV